jgi:hypothetical protein
VKYAPHTSSSGRKPTNIIENAPAEERALLTEELRDDKHLPNTARRLCHGRDGQYDRL